MRVTKPTKSPPVFDFSLPGSTEPVDDRPPSTRASTAISRARYVDIGDRVEAGQLLAEIAAPDLDAQLNASRAQLEQTRAALGIAKVTYEREQRLLAQKVVSKQEYDQSRGDLQPGDRQRQDRRGERAEPDRAAGFREDHRAVHGRGHHALSSTTAR